MSSSTILILVSELREPVYENKILTKGKYQKLQSEVHCLVACMHVVSVLKEWLEEQ